jgi:hypothetical protein
MVRIFMLTSALAGCSAIDGFYTGECTLEVGDQKKVYELELEIDQEDDDLMGDARVSHKDTYDEGEIAGSINDDEAPMEIRFQGIWSANNMDLDGSLDGRHIKGGCSFGNNFGSFDVIRNH